MQPDTTLTSASGTRIDRDDLIVTGDHLASCFLEYNAAPLPIAPETISPDTIAVSQIAGAIASLLAFAAAEHGRESIEVALGEARAQLAATCIRANSTDRPITALGQNGAL